MRILTLFVASLAFGLAGCGGGGNDSASQTEAATTGGAATTGRTREGEGDPRAGEIVWVQEGCNNCHAIDGMPATSLDGPNFDKTKPDHDSIIEAVTNGKGTMQGFADTLSPQDIANVAAYIESAARGS